MDRRSWVKLGGVVCTTAAAVPFLFQRRASGEAPGQTLVRDPERLFDLRSGLNYRVLERVFDPMSDGYKVPGRPDGMACFNGAPGTWVLMRNHELDYNLSLSAYRGSPAAEAYDAEAAGSVTRLVLDAKTGQRMSSNLVLAGTEPLGFHQLRRDQHHGAWLRLFMPHRSRHRQATNDSDWLWSLQARGSLRASEYPYCLPNGGPA